MANFKIGEKVVCIDDSAGWSSGEKLLEKNKMYTVVGINHSIDNNIFIDDGSEMSWNTKRFRKLHHAFAEEVIKMICEEPIEV